MWKRMVLLESMRHSQLIGLDTNSFKDLCWAEKQISKFLLSGSLQVLYIKKNRAASLKCNRIVAFIVELFLYSWCLVLNA